MKDSTKILIVLVAIAGFLAYGNGVLEPFGIAGPDSGDQTIVVEGATGSDGVAISCPDSSSTMTVGPLEEKFNPTATVTSYSRVFVGGVDKGLYANGDTIPVAVGKSVDITYASNDSSTGYYANNVHIDAAPCGPFDSASFDTDKQESKLYDINPTAADELDITIFARDTKATNTATSPQTLTNNDVKNFDMTIFGSSKDAVSPNGKIYYVFEGNQSEFDEISITGDGVKKADKNPPQHTIGNTASKIWSYTGPACISNCDFEYVLTLDVKDVNPNGNINVTGYVYDEDWYKNSDGEINPDTKTTMFFGVADDSDNDVGSAGDSTAEFTIYLQ